MKKKNPNEEYLNLCKNLDLILEFKSKKIELKNNNFFKSKINIVLQDLYRYRKIINLDSKSGFYPELNEKEKEKLDKINHFLFRSIIDLKNILKNDKIINNSFDNLIKFYTYVRDFIEVKDNSNKMIDIDNNNQDDLKIDILTNLFSTM
jgi:hypothetical protein